MKSKRRSVLLAAALSVAVGCESFLDVNNNPNAPQNITANLYLPSILHWMTTAPQFDGRVIGQYTQQWMVPAASPGDQFDRMFSPLSDTPGELWRTVYWLHGKNVLDMMAKATDAQQWDIVGIGYVVRAWGWQQLTDAHGEIIVKQAYEPDRYTFDYDSQEFVYTEIQRLLDSAFVYLERTDGNSNATVTARGDRVYNGDRTKWLKLAYGLKARVLNNYSNKASYKPADVIAAVDKSFASNADDFLLTYPNTQNDDINFLGRTRGNFQSYRQTEFVVGLMDGTVFGGVVDPRMSRMLSPAPDGQYRGLDIDVVGYGAVPASQRPNNFYGYPDAGGLQLPGRYLFDDKAKMPAMTYAQLQFVKAEAAYKAGDKATALNAYRTAISAHIDFVNSRNLDNGQTPTQISAAEKSAFLAAPEIVPTSPANLTLTQIMSQKYIAQWAWGHNEVWLDMRRYHYTDIDPASGVQVYPGFTPPVNLYPDNNGKIVHRIRPRYNSEYVWNRPGLDAIGGLALDYHTKPMWITEP
jgi:hypothetical protein